MKRLTFIALLVTFAAVLLTAVAPAQQGPPRGNRSPEAMLQRLKDSLTLSADQLTKVKTIMTKTSEEMTKLRNDLQDDCEALMMAVRESREKQNAQIDSVLTKDQRAKFKQMNENMRAQMPGRPGGGGGMRGN